jgi:hypothetical protein
MRLPAKSALLIVLHAWVASCSAAHPTYRKPDLRDAIETGPVTQTQADDLWSAAHATFDTRCVLCHGCYDAPCQLKLESLAGVQRGATAQLVYDASRLMAATPTRLGIDAHLVSDWRAIGFHTVVPELPGANPAKSVLVRMLELKRAHPLTSEVDIEKSFTLGLERDQSCTTAEDFDDYSVKHPLWGMPYALPAIEPERHAAVLAWVQAGAPPRALDPLPPAILQAIASWEAFFNEPSLKSRLSARYIYEHLFVASLYFKGIDDDSFFRLVRSHTPSGFPVAEIPTRRPFEDPGPGPFYYRFVRREGVKLAKTHMPYALDAARMSRYKALFIEPAYEVRALPSYELSVSANPLRAFAELPPASRYRFMLDEAEFTLMGFIKGPVCRGQAALNVIQDRFWVAFRDPKTPFSSDPEKLLASVDNDIELPAQGGSNVLPTYWTGFASNHLDYVAKRNALWAQAAKGTPGIDLPLIWDGDGTNSNAALTVFRHFDSATVVRGFVGGPPKTVWVMDYPMLERVHYLLVAGFDVFGNVGHQLISRLYMDLLRMEGEANYLAFLPSARRKTLADAWYKGITKPTRERVQRELTSLAAEPRLKYRSPQPELEFDALLEQRTAAVRVKTFDLAGANAGPDLERLDTLRGVAASVMPELAFAAIGGQNGETHYVTLVHDRAHTNLSALFFEEDRRVPAEDELHVVPGFLGAYPNALFVVSASDVPEFAKAIESLTSAADYAALRKRFGVLRSSRAFWAFSDRLHAAYRQAQPLESGMFDYNRLEGL